VALIESGSLFSLYIGEYFKYLSKMRIKAIALITTSLFLSASSGYLFDQFRSVLQIKRNREGMSSLKPSWYSNVNPNVFISTVVIIGIFIAIVFLAPNAFDLITKQLNQWVTD
jgi:hypothetical protein